MYPDETKKDSEKEDSEYEIAVDSANTKEGFMYFIRSGIYSVSFEPPSKSLGLDDAQKPNESN